MRFQVAVRDGVSGFLVDGHEPRAYARALRRFITQAGTGARTATGDALADRMGEAAARHAAGFGWDAAAASTLDVYAAALHDQRRRLRSAHG